MKLGAFVIGVLMPIFVMVASASAHVSQSNNGVSAVLHILPDDNPVAAEQTFMQFSFGNSTNAFLVKDCDCKLTVSDGSRDIMSLELEPIDPGSSKALAIVQFPKGGVYNLVMTGSAGQASAQDFRLNYLVRVAGAGEGRANTAAGLQVMLVSVAGLLILFRIAYSMISANSRYNTVQPAVKRPKK